MTRSVGEAFRRSKPPHPFLAALGYFILGAWRRKKDQELIRLDRFSYGFLFAFAMALVRFMWGDHV